ncbi:MAG: hypothetical protein ACHQU1_12305 [Gemmatimonadales bacterium]
MPLVRCPKHGRVYDSDKEEGCPLCLQELAAPRAPKPQPEGPKPPSPLLNYLLIGLVLAIAGYGAYYYFVVRKRPSDAAVEYSRRRAAAASALAERGTGDTTKFVDPNDLSPVRQARALKAALESLLQSQRSQLLGFSEGPINSAATDRAERRRVKDYLTFVRRWNERIDAATRHGTEFLYPPGTRLGSQMETVTNQLQAALSVLRDMTPPDHVKPRSERQSDAVAAGGYLNAAGTVLTNLPK